MTHSVMGKTSLKIKPRHPRSDLIENCVLLRLRSVVLSFSKPDKTSMKQLESINLTWIKLNTPAYRDCVCLNFNYVLRGIYVSGDEWDICVNSSSPSSAEMTDASEKVTAAMLISMFPWQLYIQLTPTFTVCHSLNKNLIIRKKNGQRYYIFKFFIYFFV